MLSMKMSRGVNDGNYTLGLSVLGILSLTIKIPAEKGDGRSVNVVICTQQHLMWMSHLHCLFTAVIDFVAPGPVLSALPGDFLLGSLCERLFYHLWEISVSCLSCNVCSDKARGWGEYPKSITFWRQMCNVSWFFNEDFLQACFSKFPCHLS